MTHITNLVRNLAAKLLHHLLRMESFRKYLLVYLSLHYTVKCKWLQNRPNKKDRTYPEIKDQSKVNQKLQQITTNEQGTRQNQKYAD